MICLSVLITVVCLLLDYCIVVLTVVVLHWADGCCVDVCTHWANGSLSLVHIWRWVVRNWHDSNSSTTQSRRLSLHQRSGTNPKGRRGETRSGHEWRRMETAKEEEWRENSRTQMSREGKEGEREKGEFSEEESEGDDRGGVSETQTSFHSLSVFLFQTHRNHQDVSLHEDSVSLRCGWTVSTLCNYLTKQTKTQVTEA